MVLPLSVHALQTDLTDDATIDASVTITRAAGSCTISNHTDLSYGTLTRPSSDEKTASYDPNADAPACEYGDADDSCGGSPTVGSLTFTVANTNNVNVGFTALPDDLSRDGCTGDTDASGPCALTHATVWSYEATNPTVAWTSPSGAASTGDIDVGEGVTREFTFHLGGDVTVPSTFPAGSTEDLEYAKEIVATVTCGY